jgi:predicted ATPase/DNA-binding CsgD family transcriptional regulator
LGVEGEQILPVPPLSTPGAESDVLAQDGTGYESVALFLDRATAVEPNFQIVDANRSAVLELCRRLEGIPLALELAAVGLRMLSPAQILDRLEDRFRLLTTGKRATPARQQTLDNAIGWSYDLCSVEEQLMWARLSVFSGGFDLEASEEVCCGDGIDRDDVLDLVAGLVNKSIIIRQTSEHTTAWYQMLESVRQYGAERLTDHQVRAWRIRHRDHYRWLAQRFASESFSPHQADWFIRLRREHDNVRAALEFCLESPEEAAAALDIAAPMWNFWYAGFLREGHRYLIRSLALATEPTPSRANALWAAGTLAMFAGEFDQTSRLLDECGELAERFDDDLLRARVKESRGHAALYQGDLPTALALLEDARAGYRAVEDPLGEFDTLILLAAATFFLDDSRVDEFSRQALALAEDHGARSSKAYALWSVGIAQWRASRLEQATHCLRECIRLFQSMHDLTGISFGVQALSWCAALASPDERAARLLGASQAVWHTSGAKVDETNAYGMFDERSENAVRDALGRARFEQAFAEGASYSFDQALALALGEDSETGAPQQAATEKPRAGGALTRREWEIAELLAQGLSNKEVAARLVISQRTAESHVEHILAKLGMTSRSQVGSWVVEQQAR